jgi:TetR/AcrR family transcriptional repressor of bet genes
LSQAAPERAGPGRPSTGARERILEAALDVLKSDGYAGLTIAKVAARAGENKALISYHYGSKDGLIAAAARELGQIITDDVLGGLEGATTVEELVRGAVEGTSAVLERDDRLARIYFDLNAVSVVDNEVQSVMREVKDQWRRVLAGMAEDTGMPVAEARVAAIAIITANEGLSLEWIERGMTDELADARELLVKSLCAGLGA